MILHLLDDSMFANGAYDFFEEYYQGLNHFFIQISRREKMLEGKKNQKARFFYKVFTRKEDINFIIKYARNNGIKHILVHNLSPTKAALGNWLKKQLGAKTYWIFYGADLYGRLNALGKYNLYDEVDDKQKKEKSDLKSILAFWYLFMEYPNNAYNRFIKELDFFCFWNEYDYFLLKAHFNTAAVHKPFLYYQLIDLNHKGVVFEKKASKVLINHCASVNGNHKTILKKLEGLKDSAQIAEIIAPLSYGSEDIKLAVSEFGKSLFGNRFIPIKNILPMGEYYKLLDEIPVAIFGNRRQEAGANVFYLLGKGSKVFFRNDNNMIKWLRDRGFRVFSFEDELNSIDDLKSLSIEDMHHNIKIHEELFSKDRERKDMQRLMQE